MLSFIFNTYVLRSINLSFIYRIEYFLFEHQQTLFMAYFQTNKFNTSFSTQLEYKFLLNL